MPSWFTVGCDGDPIRMRCLHVIVGGMRISSCDYDHSQLAASLHQIAKRVAGSEPLAAMMKRHLGRVIRHATSRAQANGVRLRALEIIEPELQVKLAWIILD